MVNYLEFEYVSLYGKYIVYDTRYMIEIFFGNYEQRKNKKDTDTSTSTSKKRDRVRSIHITRKTKNENLD